MSEVSLKNYIFKCVGGLAVVVCIASMVPQILKIRRTKKTDDLSKTGYYINLTGVLLIEIYSFYFNLWELFIPNLVSILLILLQILMKKCYDNNDDGVLDNDYQSFDHNIEVESASSERKVPSVHFDLDEDIIENEYESFRAPKQEL